MVTPETMKHDAFYHWYQWHTNIVQGSSNGAIGTTVGANGTDRWLSIMQTIYRVGKITNKGNSHDSIWRMH